MLNYSIIYLYRKVCNQLMSKFIGLFSQLMLCSLQGGICMIAACIILLMAIGGYFIFGKITIDTFCILVGMALIANSICHDISDLKELPKSKK